MCEKFTICCLSIWSSPKFCHLVNFLQNDKILDRSKLKAFADNKIYVTEKLKFALGRVKNIVGKRENADNQHFPLFPQYFRKVSYTRSLKVVIV